MKVSIKFREDRSPLYRAKVPVTVLGLPFRASVCGGDSKELSLSLATLFPSGPSLTAVYHPNDTRHPFRLLLKTGTAAYGSPSSTPISVTVDFNPFDFGNPRFLLHFRPRLGDFSLTKSLSSALPWRPPSPESSQDPDSHPDSPGKKKLTAALTENPLSGMGVTARTALPIRGSTVLNFRWSVGFRSRRFPGGDIFGSLTEGISGEKLPVLAMEKIGIEHVAAVVTETPPSKEEVGVGLERGRVLEMLERESRMLRKTVEGLVMERGEKKKKKEMQRSGVEGIEGVKEEEEVFAGKGEDKKEPSRRRQ